MFTPFFFDVTWDASKKRTRKSSDLALSWLDTLLKNLSDEEKVRTIFIILILALFVSLDFDLLTVITSSEFLGL